MAYNSRHHIEVSSVGLVDLKAEISRRQLEVKQKAQRLSDGCTVIKNGNNLSGSSSSIWRKRKHENEKTNVSAGDTMVSTADADAQQLERSRRALEAKSKIYDAFKAAAMSGSYSYSKSRLNALQNDEDGPLVDFEKKALDRRSPSIPRSPERNDSENDSFSDQETEKESDPLVYTGDYIDSLRSDEKRFKNNSDTEPPPRPDGPLTYAHLRDGEIREHGVGFYTFSQDAAQREAEMNRLRELHRATEEGRARAQAIRAKRDARMGQRLARLRARKGLPDVATAAAQCLDAVSAPPTPLPLTADAQSDIRLGSDDLDVASMLRRLRDEAELRQAMTNPAPPPPPAAAAEQSFTVPQSNLADVLSQQSSSMRNRKSRDWDRGKSMVSAQHYIRGEREKRNAEYAPPSFY